MVDRFRSTGSRLVLAATMALAPFAALGEEELPSSSPGLPEGARPLSYAAELRLDPRQPELEGTIHIRLVLEEATDLLWLNGTELDVDAATFAWEEREIEAEPVAGDRDFMGFRFPEAVGPGEGTLTVRYRGTFSSEEAHGLFRQELNGDWYLFSRFEPNHTRRVFPCFDEPRFEVPWELTLEVPAEMMAVTNTLGLRATTRLAPAPPPAEDEASDEDDETASSRRRLVPAWTHIRYAATPPISSHRVAIGVGTFDVARTEPAGSKGTTIRIFTPRERAEEIGYLREILPEILESLETAFDAPYPHGKLDLLAVPRSLGFEAASGPGLVAYGEPLFDAEGAEPALEAERLAASVLAREMALQWLDPLIADASWDGASLQGSLAAWLGDAVLVQLRPEWDANSSRVLTRKRALDADLQLSPPSVDGGRDKAAAVLSMFASWVGRERFQETVLGRLRQGPATADDLLAALAAAYEPGLTDAVRSFLDQGEVPMVRVSLRCAEGETPALELVQERLPAQDAAPGESVWHVPVCAAYPGDDGERARSCTLLATKTGRLVLDQAEACPDWVLANDGGHGYYVARYEDGLLDALLTHGREDLTSAERLGLRHDGALLAGELAEETPTEPDESR